MEESFDDLGAEVGDVAAEATELIACAEEDALLCLRRVFWLTRPSPWWCNGRHEDGDHPDDRRHFSAWEGRLPLTLEAANEFGTVKGYQPEYVEVHVDRGVLEADPRTWCGKGETSQGWNMTEGEARRLAVVLTAAADLARQDSTGSVEQLTLPLGLVAA